VAVLLHENKVPTLDEPLARWYPEWKDGPRAKITLRHVLTHTSGLAPRPAGAEPAKDGIAAALALKPKEEAGAKVLRNPDLFPLLAGLFPRTVKKPMDAYLAKQLHRTLRIESWTWAKDEAGTPRAADGLSMTSGDLARLGRLVVDGGTSARKMLIGKARLEEMWDPTKPIVMRGRLGQWLVIVLEKKLVAVRLRRSRDERDDTNEDYDFPLFFDLLRATLK